jgi:tetratricopeptide (TPR) repeat protein
MTEVFGLSAQLEELRKLALSGCHVQAVRAAEELIAGGALVPAEVAEVHHISSVCWYRLGKIFKALPEADRALQIALQAGMPELSSKVRSNLVGLYVATGDWGRAIEEGERFSVAADPARAPYVHHNLALAHQARRDREQMLYHYRQAVSLSDAVGAPAALRVQIRQQFAWQLLLLDRIAEADQHTEGAGALVGQDDEDGVREQILLGSLRSYQTGGLSRAFEQAEEIIYRGAPSSEDQKRQTAWANLICGWVSREWSKLGEAEGFATVAMDLAMDLQWPEMMNRANRLRLEVIDQREDAG